MRFPTLTTLLLAVGLPSAAGVAIRLPGMNNAIQAPTLPSEHLSFHIEDLKNNVDGYFDLAYRCDKGGKTFVLEAPCSQDGIKLYIAIDGDSFCSETRPGNGGLRLLQYDSDEDAMADAVRLASGMTRKHMGKYNYQSCFNVLYYFLMFV